MEKTRLPPREEGFTSDLLVPWTTQWTSCFCLHTSTSLPVPQFLGCQGKNATLTVTTAQGHLSPDSLCLLSSELQSLGPCSGFLSHLAPRGASQARPGEQDPQSTLTLTVLAGK